MNWSCIEMRGATAGALIIAAMATTAQAGSTTTFEWTEGGPGNGTNSAHQSRHGVRGPVLADDFVPAIGGSVTSVEWWGSAAYSRSWEITFHSDDFGSPEATSPSGGIAQEFVTAIGSDPDGDGVFHFSADWSSFADPALTAGDTFWFSVANFTQGWTWANAGPATPTVGSENHNAVVSTGVGPNGGPHFGPWAMLFAGDNQMKQDFAFRINVIPVPASLPFLTAGLLGFAYLGRRRRRTA